eukprot:TRINITY_DN4280_c0_g1_i1.p1 TRINITY_DN4280_c0_g1~~TRINITY_DN4280_c0_g1_i1.p1  ORF type:complete len:305 (+),score=34.04 TRINITY_DN4280_c0_g1_i1:165-1079(+)
MVLHTFNNNNNNLNWRRPGTLSTTNTIYSRVVFILVVALVVLCTVNGVVEGQVNICPTFTTCSTCSTQVNCGWCRVDNGKGHCLSGNINGPDKSNCTDWDYTLSSCPNEDYSDAWTAGVISAVVIGGCCVSVVLPAICVASLIWCMRRRRRRLHQIHQAGPVPGYVPSPVQPVGVPRYNYQVPVIVEPHASPSPPSDSERHTLLVSTPGRINNTSTQSLDHNYTQYAASLPTSYSTSSMSQNYRHSIYEHHPQHPQPSPQPPPSVLPHMSYSASTHYGARHTRQPAPSLHQQQQQHHQHQNWNS